MKVTWRTEWPHWVLLVGMFALAATAWSTAPDRIPMHWNIAGQVDRYGGRVEGLLAIPLLSLAIYALMILLPRIDPGRANYSLFAGPYAALRLMLLVVMAAIYGLTHLAMRGVPVRIETWVPLIVGALFVMIGNLLGKVRPNWFVGIRNPWTLSSKDAWNRTHRAGGWVFVLMGLLLMSVGLVHAAWAVWGTAILIGAAVIGLNVYSYLVWRNDPERTSPAGSSPAGDGA
jgi:uncharacterized membrane protein